MASVDPHRLDDPVAMFFGGALYESLYGLDASGATVPVLAESMPKPSQDGLGVTLRQGVRFASGKRLTPHDVLSSLARARALAGKGWFEPVGVARLAQGAEASRTVQFAGRSIEGLTRALASPLSAIVPEHFSPDEPDGTGPFAAQPPDSSGARTLVRNELAASGPAFLDRILLGAAENLAASLRAFESGEDDVGWLGLGLHEPRRGAVAFDAGNVGWAILRTGEQLGRWNLPGVAQRLADGIEPSRLAQIGVTADWSVEPDEGWGGPPVALLVRADSPWLVELARAVSAALSRPNHEVTVKPVAVHELGAFITSKAYGLALDVARPFDATALGTYAALASADDLARGAELTRHPPLGEAGSLPRAIGRVLRVGVVAGIRLAGGHLPSLTLPSTTRGCGIDFASITQPQPRVF